MVKNEDSQSDTLEVSIPLNAVSNSSTVESVQETENSCFLVVGLQSIRNKAKKASNSIKAFFAIIFCFAILGSIGWVFSTPGFSDQLRDFQRWTAPEVNTLKPNLKANPNVDLQK